jgi:hypothetical protein
MPASILYRVVCQDDLSPIPAYYVEMAELFKNPGINHRLYTQNQQTCAETRDNLKVKLIPFFIN